MTAGRAGAKGPRRLLLLLAALVPLAAGPAFALTGATGVKISAQCGDGDATVTIESDPGLHDSMLVTGDAGAIQAPTGGRGEATVELGCSSDAAMTVTVPRDAGFHVAIDGIGGANWHVGEIVSHLDVELRGSGDLVARALPGGFTASSFASGNVSVGRVGGDVEFHGRGSGDLSIDEIAGGHLLIDTMGSGDANVKSGHVGALTVQSRGSSDVTVGADAETADLSTFGSGDIHVAHVAGQLTQSHAGSGEITVDGRRSGEHVAINWDQKAGHDLVIQTGDGHTAHVPSSVIGELGKVLGIVVLVAMGLLALVLVVAFLAVLRRRQAGLPPRRATLRPRAPDPRIADLGQHLARLAQRASRLETLVTSKEFELHRGFRELGD